MHNRRYYIYLLICFLTLIISVGFLSKEVCYSNLPMVATTTITLGNEIEGLEGNAAAVPVSAMHLEDGGRYVYVLGTRRGFEGEETIVQRISVVVMGRNEDYYFIEQGSVSQSQKIVTRSDIPISHGMVVRLAK